MLAFVTSAFLLLTIIFGVLAWLGPVRFGTRGAEGRVLGLKQRTSLIEDGQGAAAFKRPQSSIPTLRRVLGESEWAKTAERDLAQAGVRLRVGEYLLARVALSSAFLFVLSFVSQFHIIGIVGGAIAGGAVYVFTPSLLHFLRQRRLAEIVKQLVEFLPLMASSLRAGFAFQQGVELALQQIDPPLADELAVMLNDTNLGATMEDALIQMGERVGSTDLDMVITAVLVQRSTGGNLSEILDTAAHTLTERERIRGEMKTLTASQRMTGLILSIYPIAVWLVLLLIMPSLWSVMFTETLGRIFLGVALGLQLLGFFAMQRVMRVQF